MARPVAFPLGFRISSRPIRMPKHFNASKPLPVIAACDFVPGSGKRIIQQFQFPGLRNTVRSSFPNYYSVLSPRSFSSSNSDRVNGRIGKSLPWLAASAERGQKRVVKNEITKPVRSSWEESAEKFLKGDSSTVEIRETRRYGRRGIVISNNDDTHVEDEDEDEDDETEIGKDPRWYKIRERFSNRVELKPKVYDRPEVRRWNNQENWGKKTWKEAKESSVPKMVGEGVYGVGPVLAALSSGRREFYALYVQEGLDLSMNNKKKDKKGFEKILKMAEKLELNRREISKHDLNMIVENRPHQGLVLDASPLEMVGIKELEPVPVGGEKGLLWLALDEVTDPQNLGAIIRSAYFFGASGVVLCAKNSAPLSGVVSKASAGSVELMEIRSCKNMMQFLASSAENGWRVLGGSVAPKSVSLNEIVPGAPTILVLGSEGTGLRPLVERSCTQLVRIPGNLPVDVVMTGDEDLDAVGNPGQEFQSFWAVESLNVSVAAGVLLHHLIGTKQDGNSDGMQEIA